MPRSLTLEPGEVPRLEADGVLFYVRYRPGSTRFWPDSEGFSTLEEAVAAAEARVPGPVTWR